MEAFCVRVLGAKKKHHHFVYISICQKFPHGDFEGLKPKKHKNRREPPESHHWRVPSWSFTQRFLVSRRCVPGSINSLKLGMVIPPLINGNPFTGYVQYITPHDWVLHFPFDELFWPFVDFLFQKTMYLGHLFFSFQAFKSCWRLYSYWAFEQKETKVMSGEHVQRWTNFIKL